MRRSTVHSSIYPTFELISILPPYNSSDFSAAANSRIVWQKQVAVLFLFRRLIGFPDTRILQRISCMMMNVPVRFYGSTTLHLDQGPQTGTFQARRCPVSHAKRGQIRRFVEVAAILYFVCKNYLQTFHM
jgi:hypothetical protein